MRQDKRRPDRLMVNLPVQAQVGSSDVQSLKVVDIRPSGMQIESEGFEVLKAGFDAQHNRAEFGLQIAARMAWVQNNADGDYLTGWEFVLGGGDVSRECVSDKEDGNRRHSRLQIELAVRARVGAGEYEDMEVVDISPSGMQIRSTDFEPFKVGLDVHTNRAEFSLLIAARLAWVQTCDNDEYLTGWEFGIGDGEERFG